MSIKFLLTSENSPNSSRIPLDVQEAAAEYLFAESRRVSEEGRDCCIRLTAGQSQVGCQGGRQKDLVVVHEAPWTG